MGIGVPWLPPSEFSRAETSTEDCRLPVGEKNTGSGNRISGVGTDVSLCGRWSESASPKSSGCLEAVIKYIRGKNEGKI